jgi:hypothetical protein
MAHFPNGDGDGGHGRQHAGFGSGGKSLPSLAQAARATCCLTRRATTQRWSLLTIFFRGDLFCHFIDAGDPICQKFYIRDSSIEKLLGDIFL